MLDVTIKGLDAFRRRLEAARKEEVKAFETAVRVEGYGLMKALKYEIRRGTPGGKPLAALSMIARKRSRTTRPLRRLALAVRYVVEKEPFRFRLGWTGPQVSKRWKHLARIHQTGFTLDVTEDLRRRLARIGASLPERGKYRSYFFIRKTTEIFRTPARPILDPFWRAHHDSAWKNIRNNYRRKRRGERI